MTTTTTTTTTTNEAALAIRNDIMGRAPFFDVAGSGHQRAFSPKFAGRCSISGHTIQHWHTIRMSKFTCWDKQRAVLTGAQAVFMNGVSWRSVEDTPQCAAVPFKRVEVSELIAAMIAGCRVRVFADPMDSSAFTDWGYVEEAQRFWSQPSAAVRGRRGSYNRTEAQVTRYMKPKGAFAVQILTQSAFGSWVAHVA